MTTNHGDSINEKFERRKSGVECPMCPDSGESDLVAHLASGRVHLQNDANYRGYCILVFRRHAVELHDLTDDERRRWIDDINSIGRAVTDLCAPAKLNITMLGNMVPHLHCHIIPRYQEDSEWGHPPAYRRPSERRKIEMAEYEALRARLREALDRT